MKLAFVALHFSIQNIYQSWDLGHAVGAEQHQAVTFFVYWRLSDVGHVSPWRKALEFHLLAILRPPLSKL